MIKKVVKAPLWTNTYATPAQYPWLDTDISCDVAVVGGGIAAALCALRFAEAGLHTVLFSATPVGHGSTAVSSGILSLTGEDSFSCLVEKIGAERALDAISLMEEAIGNIEKLCGECDGQGIPGGNCGFRRLDCLRYTVSESAESRIRQEYSLQLHNGFVAELLSPITASSQFTFPMAAGVYTKGAAGQVDPYRLVHAVILLAKQKGAQIYENTAVTAIRPETAEGEYAAMELDCATGHQVKANYVIVAAGLEAGRHCGGLEQPRTTYMVATEPVEDFAGWRGPCVIHREGEPRLYLSVTADNRILIGGLDSALMDEKGRVAGAIDLSAAADKRFELLECTLREMFPAIRGITPEYVFAARDGRTPDGLPVIGRLPQKKNKEAASHVAYAFCCGDNGILHAEIASRLLLEQVQGKDNHQLGLFSPNRHWRIKR